MRCLAACSRIARRFVDTVFTQCPHMIGTRSPQSSRIVDTVFAQFGWTHRIRIVVPTSHCTFFELHSCSSKNVAAGHDFARNQARWPIGDNSKG